MAGLRGTIDAYRTSLALAGRIRSLSADAPPAEVFAFNQREPAIVADQKREEILWLLDLLRREAPKVVLEIGTQHGGTLFLFSRVAADDALLVSVDQAKMIGRLGRFSPNALVRHSFARAQQRVELVDAADSQSEETREIVERVLGGRRVDFLFIDGDHRYEGVTRDFRLYAPLVRAGGLVGFHDVSSWSTPDTEGVARFWQELKRRGGTEDRVSGSGDPGYGIGVYRVPSEEAPS